MVIDMKLYVRFYLILVSVVLCTFGVYAQEYHGTTGLLQVPSAETELAGTFRGGVSWVDKRMLPDVIPSVLLRGNGYRFHILEHW